MNLQRSPPHDRRPETRLFRAHWQDGTLDLLAGCAILLIGVGYLFDQVLVPAVVVPLAFAAWFALRKRVIEPRAGFVEFGARRRERSSREAVGVLLAGVLVLALALVVGLGPRDAGADPGAAVDALPALLLALLAFLASGLTRTWRFALYGTLLAAAGLGSVLVDAGPGVPLILGGAVAGVSGATLLARFLAESRRAAERR